MALATRMLLVMLTLGRRGNGRKDMVLVVAAAAAALHGSEEVAAAAALDQHHRPLAVEQGRALLLLQLRVAVVTSRQGSVARDGGSKQRYPTTRAACIAKP